jgi:phosphoribosyl 1,2-cyclic phosphodiesterase
MRVVSLGSGSSGNALLVEAGPQKRTKLLIDAGLNGRILAGRLQSVSVNPIQLQGALVTHEHIDHVLGLPTLMKRYAVPVVTDPHTYDVIESSLASNTWRTDSGTLFSSKGMMADKEVQCDNGDVSQDSLHEGTANYVLPLPVGSRCLIGDIEVESFPVSHDAAAPCGYLLQAGGCRVCVVTDSGEVTDAMLERMRHADLLILEANHDRERLLRGPYSQALKMRILSSTGHLSNDQTADAILRTWRTDSVRWLWLAHLSRTNNTPSLALSSVRGRLLAAKANLAQVHISVLPPDMGYIWDSTELWRMPLLWEMLR